jgi:hypothetical protein
LRGASGGTCPTTAIASACPPARLPTLPTHSTHPPASTHFQFVSARRSPSSPPAPTRRQRPWRAWELTTLLLARMRRRWRRPRAPCTASSTLWQVRTDTVLCVVRQVQRCRVQSALAEFCKLSCLAARQASILSVLSQYCRKWLLGSGREPEPVRYHSMWPQSTLPVPALHPRPPIPLHHPGLPAAKHELSTYMPLLRTNGKFVIVGVPPEPFELHSFAVVFSECCPPSCLPACPPANCLSSFTSGAS